ncbi:MAG: hypothetical protein OHK0048_01280 [Rhodoferax sp.]
MTRRRWGVIGVLVAMAGLLAVWLQRPIAVSAQQVHRGTLVRSVQFSARVAAQTRVELGSTLTGRVARVTVREGDAVQAGDVLVQLEADEWRAALAQQRAALAQAQARLQGLKDTGRRQVDAALAQAQASLNAAEQDLQRTRQLVAQGFVSSARLDESERAWRVALAQRDAALAQVRANADTGSDGAQAQAQWAQAQAGVEAAQAKLAQTLVRAPADGRVLLRSVEPGQIVQPGRALLTLALAGPTHIKAQVDERYLGQLRPGQSASLVPDAYPEQRLSGQLLSIAPRVDAQRGAVEVTLALTQAAPAELREDMTLSVEVETARRDAAVTLPLAALRSVAGTEGTEGDTAQVLVVQDGRALARRVRLGVRNLASVEVLEGLNDGDWVLLDERIAPGQRVRPQPVTVGATRPTAEASGGAAGAVMTQSMGR